MLKDAQGPSGVAWREVLWVRRILQFQIHTILKNGLYVKEVFNFSLELTRRPGVTVPMEIFFPFTPFPGWSSLSCGLSDL